MKPATTRVPLPLASIGLDRRMGSGQGASLVAITWNASPCNGWSPGPHRILLDTVHIVNSDSGRVSRPVAPSLVRKVAPGP